MNRLINESSLYLKQHAHNPVDWFAWGDEALKKAKSEDKPILISIGYSSCHWCHVMERESFESQEVAEYLNAHFVAIKVDREERPDLDHIYMEALQTLSGQGGWPLNMFLTPDQKPFYGGTYFPPRPMYGRPSFLQILHKMHEIFSERRAELEQKALQLTQAISSDFTENMQPTSLDLLDVKAIVDVYKFQFEPDFGGFSSAPKFPQPMILDALMVLAQHYAYSDAKTMVFKTLDEMGKGGMYDQIGGGFHRYSTDREWLAPHFEKMLYDNAQLLSTYSKAYRLSGNPFYYSIAEGIYTCLIRDFIVENEGFGSAWDADSEGEEGAFYVWNSHDVKKHLAESDWERFCALVEWKEEGNWEGHLIIRLKTVPTVEETAFLKTCWEVLFPIRKQKEHPVKDSKVVLAWNGMALQGLYDWYVTSGNETVKTQLLTWVDRLIQQNQTKGKWERVLGVTAFSDDLANMGLACLRAFQVSGNEKYVSKAQEIAEELREHFINEDGTGFTLAPRNQAILHNPKDVFDNAVPSSNASCVQFFAELGHITSDNNLIYIAQQVTQKLTVVLQKYPTSMSKHVQNALLMKLGFKECVLVGDVEKELFSVFNSTYDSSMLLFQVDEEGSKSLELLKGKRVLMEKATAYVCKNFSCEAPVFEKRDLKLQLSV